MIHLDTANLVWRCNPPNNWEIIGTIHDGEFLQIRDLGMQETLEVVTALPLMCRKEKDVIFFVAPRKSMTIRNAYHDTIYHDVGAAAAQQAQLGAMFVVCKCVLNSPERIITEHSDVIPVTSKKPK